MNHLGAAAWPTLKDALYIRTLRMEISRCPFLSVVIFFLIFIGLCGILLYISCRLYYTEAILDVPTWICIDGGICSRIELH
jgi:hypothetical protein